LKIIPKVKSLEEVKEFRRITSSVSMRLQQFQSSLLLKIADTFLLRTIHDRMRGFGYSEKIILGTTISSISLVSATKFRVFVHSEYFAETGFDVAVGRERGTTRHFIKPDKKKALKFDGDKFSKGHFVDGIIPSHIIKNTLDEIAEPFLDSYNRELEIWLEQNYRGLALIAR